MHAFPSPIAHLPLLRLLEDLAAPAAQEARVQAPAAQAAPEVAALEVMAEAAEVVLLLQHQRSLKVLAPAPGQVQVLDQELALAQVLELVPEPVLGLGLAQDLAQDLAPEQAPDLVRDPGQDLEPDLAPDLELDLVLDLAQVLAQAQGLSSRSPPAF